MLDFDTAMRKLPLIAVLRGLQPAQAVAIGQTLFDAGFRLIEVPLNSPEPSLSIRLLSDKLGAVALVGAGTVMSVQAARDVAAAGGRLIVMPHCDTDIIRAGKDLGAFVAPGIATPTEAFAALAAGADALKAFPAEMIPPAAVGAMRAVLPQGTRILPVGGITPETMASYHAAGASGFGLGSALFKPAMTVADVADRAARFVAAWRRLQPE
ncbi:2-dehydro-3-deoxy-6-phosphogalactonate aldolase [Bradyrhizobium sp.]|jgi:2-dehydro-3-deoxyphosphogalactonate aldolase|uniref:2-dehydro-3-deoxy-6-phosphogalactonate aldolase n=1 Tax=Bradyrhizobium sp. TaxID=376 RepID=UPI003C160B87